MRLGQELIEEAQQWDELRWRSVCDGGKNAHERAADHARIGAGSRIAQGLRPPVGTVAADGGGRRQAIGEVIGGYPAVGQREPDDVGGQPALGGLLAPNARPMSRRPCGPIAVTGSMNGSR